ncbi:MAG: glycosyltransferase [Acidimicrobiia bacterium]
MRVSVITTLFNEADSVSPLIDSLLAQTRTPDEIVVANAGSTDGTRTRLDELARTHPRLKVYDRSGNRSAGRNAAIQAATGDAIACIDGGCTADATWLEHLIAPLQEGADWVAGFYRPEGTTLKSTCIGLVMVYVEEEVDPESFMPSGRSMAFRKDAWAKAGGFPEHVDFAEDTLFDEQMLEAGYHPQFAGDAIVLWTPPSTYTALARTLFRWGRGDGQAGLRGFIYRRILIVYGGTLIAVPIATLFAWWALPLALIPITADTLRRTRYKYRWADGGTKYVYIPIAHVIATGSALVGFLVGRGDKHRLEGHRGS